MLRAFKQTLSGQTFKETQVPPERVGGSSINGASLTMLADSGVSGYYLDSNLSPGLKDLMVDYEELEEARKVVTTRKRVPETIATCAVQGTITNQDAEACGGTLEPDRCGTRGILVLRDESKYNRCRHCHILPLPCMLYE